jgi:PAS domain S-box-containing protein
MKPMHRLLKQQLKRAVDDPSSVPPEWQDFLSHVNEAYLKFDADHKKLERSLQASSQKLHDANSEMRAVFQAIPDLVFLLNEQGTILDIKAGAIGDLMIRRQDLIGKQIQNTPLKAVAHQFSEAIQRVIADNSPVTIEYSAVWQGGESHYEARLVRLLEKEILVIIHNITERKQSLRLLVSAVEQSTEAIMITDADLDLPGPRILFVNSAFTRMTGYSASEVLGQTPRLLQGPKSDRAVLQRLRETLGRGENFSGETVNYRKDGSEFTMEWHVTPLRHAGGKTTHFVSLQRDITQRKQTSEQLFQSQKMETVGRLAGGMAHEFNNILTAIIGQSELLLEDLPPGSPLAENAAEIRQAANRATTLTRHLLAYGRKQFLQPEALNLNLVVAGMAGMLRQLLGGSSTDLRLVPASGLHWVKADAGQLEQVIINLAINSADAMPQGGRLTLETANVVLDQNSVGQDPELKPGRYVMLAVTDTGTGMSEAVKARVFEPFFTTKDVGRGIGLGLSICYGIIKQSGGHISVFSEPGRGTTFKIYLPPIEPPADRPQPAP